MSHEDRAGGQKNTEPEQADRQHTPGLRPGKVEFKEEISLALIKDKDKKRKDENKFRVYLSNLFLFFSKKQDNFFCPFLYG